MSRDPATAAAAGSAAPAGGDGGYLGTLSNLFTSLAADATASATRAEDRVLDAVEAGIENVESGAKHLRSSLAAMTSAETRARAMASLTRRVDLAGTEKEIQISGASSYVASLERALEEYDVNNAHQVSRAQRVSDAAALLSTKLRRHANAWRETDTALAELPDTVSKAWQVDAAIQQTCELMSETEQLLLEAEIALEVDNLFARNEETRVSRKAAKTAHKGEVEKLEQFRRTMETEARDTHITQKSAEEIALEETLRKELRQIKKQARKNAKAKDGDGEKKGGAFLPAPSKEDHYGMGVDSGDDDDAWRPSGVDANNKNESNDGSDLDDEFPRRRRGTLAEAAGDVDVATAVHAARGELNDFLADEDGDDTEAEKEKKRQYYTVYGLRKQADDSRAAIAAQREAEANASTVAWLGSKSREAAEAIGLARKEALGLDDNDLLFVNLKPPPPSGGAGDDLLDEEDLRDKSQEHGPGSAGGSGPYVNYEILQDTAAASSAAAKEALAAASQTAATAAAAAAAAAEQASAQASSAFAGFGSSLYSFGEAAKKSAAASLEAAQGRAKEGAAWMNTSIGQAGDSWQRHLQGGGGGDVTFDSPGGEALNTPTAFVATPGPSTGATPVAEEISDAAPETAPETDPSKPSPGSPQPSGKSRKMLNRGKKQKNEPLSSDPLPVDVNVVNASPQKEDEPEKNLTPAAERSDRDEGFDEVMTKTATFGYWKDKDREAGESSTDNSPKPSPKPSPNKGRKQANKEVDSLD